LRSEAPRHRFGFIQKLDAFPEGFRESLLSKATQHTEVEAKPPYVISIQFPELSFNTLEQSRTLAPSAMEEIRAYGVAFCLPDMLLEVLRASRGALGKRMVRSVL